MVFVFGIALYLIMIAGLFASDDLKFVLFVVPFLVLNIGGLIYTWFFAIGRMDHADASPLMIPVAIVFLVVSTIIGMALGGWADTTVKGVISGIVITTYFTYLVKDEVGDWFSIKSSERELKEEINRQEQKQLERLAYLSSDTYRKHYLRTRLRDLLNIIEIEKSDKSIRRAAIAYMINNRLAWSVEANENGEHK